MSAYVIRENIRRFKAQLQQQELPGDRRPMLEALLKEEEAKLRNLDHPEMGPPSERG